MYIVYISATEQKITNKPILDVIKRLNHTAVDRSFSDMSENKSSFVAQTTKEIKKADGIVVEATLTNFDLGRLLTLSLLQHKPVLLLQRQGHGQDLDLGESRLVTKKSYRQNDTKKIEKHLVEFAQVIEKQRLSYRFNLMLSQDLNTYLMDRAQSRNISKADYIRGLITADMD